LSALKAALIREGVRIELEGEPAEVLAALEKMTAPPVVIRQLPKDREHWKRQMETSLQMAIGHSHDYSPLSHPPRCRICGEAQS
jgi:hypothetical protein